MATSSGFDPPPESDWHRMISEAAYFLAEDRGFEPGHALEDWLRAELKGKQVLAGSGNEVALHGIVEYNSQRMPLA
jgi:hypothetical protein